MSEHPIVGGHKKVDLQEASKVQNYLSVVLLDFNNLRLINYEKQLVNGWNHRLTYKDKDGHERTIVVYEGHQGNFEITSDTGRKN